LRGVPAEVIGGWRMVDEIEKVYDGVNGNKIVSEP
jgi:hypothetical protein